mmetsp:Transcript_25940/g.59719  ORF Transcript_25940/g.59719 Transcript_25940/m.59719 type:complete len:87 (-) Transcript_25940:25-285(-)
MDHKLWIFSLPIRQHKSGSFFCKRRALPKMLQNIQIRVNLLNRPPNKHFSRVFLIFLLDLILKSTFRINRNNWILLGVIVLDNQDK